MKTTTLNQTHRAQGAKMVEFTGYDMPIQYTEGILKEHEWVRSDNVGLFDTSHMGQFILEGEGSAAFLAKITPTNFERVEDGLSKYTVLTNHEGGIIDDLIITKLTATKFFVVLNAGCRIKDEAWIRENMPQDVTLTELADRSLIAIQGEKSEAILNDILKEGDLADLAYMKMDNYTLKNGEEVFLSRSGYTGEDGFEISIKNSAVVEFWTGLCALDEVKPIGLGARDSLRLEAGYPLYGNDLDTTTSPIEASLGWLVNKHNTTFFGAERVLKEKTEGVARKRIGVKLLDRGIAREGTEIKKDGKTVGTLTSGGFSPSLKVSIGQGYFDTSLVKIGDNVTAVVRGREIPAVLQSFSFIEARTKSVKK